MRRSKSQVTFWYFRTSGPKYVFENLIEGLLLALTPAWRPLHVPSAWSPVNPTPGIPYCSLHDISSPTPGERQGTPSVSLCHSLLSSHRAFFALLLYNLPCYTVISSLSLSHSTKSSLGATATSHPWNRHAQYVFG